MDNLENFVCHDRLLVDPLFKAGWQVEEISWSKKDVDWSNYDLVIIRSTWDYQDAPATFLKQLENINKQTKLENSFEIVKWNLDKRYLEDLQNKGLPIVPTIWSTNLDGKLASFFNELDCEEIVIKPCISANADDTFRLSKFNYKTNEKRLHSLFENRGFMVQPFVESIITKGEYSLFYFGGEYSHAILKIPRENDFRVQEEHGGKLFSIEANADLITIGQKTIETINPTPLYARVDLVRLVDGSPALIELELIEPSLYFNMDGNSIRRFVSKINEI